MAQFALGWQREFTGVDRGGCADVDCQYRQFDPDYDGGGEKSRLAGPGVPGRHGDSIIVDNVVGHRLVPSGQAADAGVCVVDHVVLPGAVGLGNKDSDGIRQDSIWGDE